MAGRLPIAWGATAQDLERVYPADTMLEGPVIVLTRAVSVAAPAELAYRWSARSRLRRTATTCSTTAVVEARRS
jgi:hypothetical protein